MKQPVNPEVSITVNGQRRTPMSRRETMQWVLGAVAASQFPAARGLAQQEVPKEEGRNILSQETAAKVPDPDTSKGYGTDPRLVKTYKPGEVWPLTFTEKHKKTATALADTIFPADQYGPTASEIGVVEMIDEWVSAPYPDQRNDRPMVLQGLEWFEWESGNRFKKGFAELSPEQRREICDDVCFRDKAKDRFRGPARFFEKFRDIAASAYYATPAGWKAIGYVGNVALEKFEGPPPEVLKILGVA